MYRKLAALGAVTLLSLTACGSEPAPTAAPAPTVTVTSPPKVETKTVEVTTVPKVCIQALDAGEKVAHGAGAGLTAAGNVIAEVPNLIDAILAMDSNEIDRITAVTQKENNVLTGVGMDGLVEDYNKKAEACRKAS